MNDIIQFDKKKQADKTTLKLLPFLMDEEIEEALSILLRIKQEENEEEKIALEYEFYGVVQNAWCREMEDMSNE